MLRITEYADKLLDGLDQLDFIERVKLQQRNWIGRSHGIDIKIRYHLRRYPDCLYYPTGYIMGATYMVLSPELGLLEEWIERGLLSNVEEIRAYQAEAARKSEFERSQLSHDKTGVRLEGVNASIGQSSRNSDFYFRLCPSELRYRSHYGGTRT